MSKLSTRLSEISERLKQATPVVSWYAHPYEGQIRGPWNRWFQIMEPTELISRGKIVRASKEHDIEMFAHAPSDLQLLVRVCEMMRGALSNMKEYADNIQEAHPEACAHGAGFSLLGQLAQQVSNDSRTTLDQVEEICR